MQNKKIKVLFIGDIFAKPGRNILKNNLLNIQEKYNVDFTIANAENSTNGKGLSFKHYKELNKLNIDIFTMGNHTFGNNEIFDYIENINNLVRPYNFGINTKGKGYVLIRKNNYNICIINLLGSINILSFMNPFNAFDEIYEKIKNKCDLIFVDFHAETTSEKIAFGYYVSDRAQVCVGTHTHVQTNDMRILNNKCAYITDVGMTGPLDGVIGIEKETIINRFLHPYYNKFKISEGISQLNAVIIEIENGNATNIKTLHIEE